MSWAELQISQPPKTGNVDFDTWMQKLVTHLRNYLGSFHFRGDPAAVDYDQTGLTTDATWRDLDLSAIVPAEAKAVVLSVYL